MQISNENFLIILLLINWLLGVTLGLWLGVFVLLPLSVIATLEAAFFATTWMSAFAWGAVLVLVCSLELGYLGGAALGVMRLPLPDRRFRRDYTAHSGQ